MSLQQNPVDTLPIQERSRLVRITSLAKSGIPLKQIATIVAVDEPTLTAQMKGMPPPQDVDLTDHPDVESLWDYNLLVQTQRSRADYGHKDKARSLVNKLLNTATDIVESGQNLTLRGVTDALATVHRIATYDGDEVKSQRDSTGAAPATPTIVHVNLGGLLNPRVGGVGMVADGGLPHVNVNPTNNKPRPVLNAFGQVVGIQEGDDITSLDSMPPDMLRELAGRNATGVSERAAKLGERSAARIGSLREVLKRQTEAARMTTGDVDDIILDVESDMDDDGIIPNQKVSGVESDMD